MSLLRHKQKLYPLGMGNPQGGGGGIISSIGNALASIDPGPAIGNALASVDNAVNQIPGGWITVGGLAAGGLALAYAPEVMAYAESAGLTPEAASAELGIPPVDASTGATVDLSTVEGPAGGTSTGTGLTTGSGATGITGGGTGVGSIAAPATNTGLVDATGAVINAPAASGANTLAGVGGGLTAQEAVAQQAAKIASEIGGGVSASDVLSNANRALKLANMITGGSTSKPTAQQFSQFQAANQPVMEQFGGLYRMNQNPFAQTQQPTTVQTSYKPHDFLAELAQEGKTTPTLADLVRNA